MFLTICKNKQKMSKRHLRSMWIFEMKLTSFREVMYDNGLVSKKLCSWVNVFLGPINIHDETACTWLVKWACIEQWMEVICYSFVREVFKVHFLPLFEIEKKIQWFLLKIFETIFFTLTRAGVVTGSGFGMEIASAFLIVLWNKK